MKMTTEEAFVKVLQMHGIEHAFGIIGSAFMPISDIFPKAGITFWDVAHETNGGLICDGYTRATGKIGMAIAQNGPGVTGFVTPIKTAYWNHTPMLLVTPQAANKTIGRAVSRKSNKWPCSRTWFAIRKKFVMPREWRRS
jgi:sulfoacetaldehyde acetyltransferase